MVTNDCVAGTTGYDGRTLCCPVEYRDVLQQIITSQYQFMEVTIRGVGKKFVWMVSFDRTGITVEDGVLRTRKIPWSQCMHLRAASVADVLFATDNPT